MTAPFREFRLIYPPHPAVTWTPKDIGGARGFVAQLKFNDWRTLIYFFPGGKIELYGRRKTKLPRYRPPKTMLDSLMALDLSKSRFHVLDGGLLHYNTARVKNTLVLWDILVHDSRYLLGTTYRERYKLLRKISHCPRELATLDSVALGYRISRNLWLARNIRRGFKEQFDLATRLPEIEGLVLKDGNAKLQRAFRMDSNARWQIRVRRPRIDYPF